MYLEVIFINVFCQCAGFSFSQMQPSMLLKLLRKLTVDVSNLSEYTTVALRVCINNYDLYQNELKNHLQLNVTTKKSTKIHITALDIAL